MKTKVICFHEPGTPAEVVKLEERELPSLKPNQVLVQMKLAPINPADINVLEGKYPLKKEPPIIPGNEGVGIVSDKGSQVKGLKKGDKVIAPGRIGSWAEFYIAEEKELVSIAPEINFETAASLSVNAATAWRLLNGFEKLKKGDWVVQNAANSIVGRAIIQIAKTKGWKTFNVVRRKELISELEQIGGDIVVTDEAPPSSQVKNLIPNENIKLGLNAVGGESALEIAKSLSAHGTLVTYGAMGRKPLMMSNALLIFKDLRLRGIWINEWFRSAKENEITSMFKELCSLVKDGKLKVPIEKIYPMKDFQEAILHAQQDRRSGKILLEMSKG